MSTLLVRDYNMLAAYNRLPRVKDVRRRDAWHGITTLELPNRVLFGEITGETNIDLKSLCNAGSSVFAKCCRLQFVSINYNTPFLAIFQRIRHKCSNIIQHFASRRSMQKIDQELKRFILRDYQNMTFSMVECFKNYYRKSV